MAEDLAIIRERVRKFIRARELATLHKLEQMQIVRMLEHRATWMKENDFGKTEVILAKMYEDTLWRLHADFDP